MQDTLLEVKNLSVDYETDEATFYAVNDISFKLNEGETVGIVGETGAGKTTTALAIMRLLPARTGRITGGEILFKGEDLLKKPENEMRLVRGALISMIFQDPMTSLNPVMTVGKQIYESLEIHNLEHKSKQQLEERVDELLELVGIPARRKNEYPHQFSGGMKQRVVIAIALACEPKLLIADEPTTALDVTIQAQVLEMMHDLKKRFGTAMIMSAPGRTREKEGAGRSAAHEGLDFVEIVKDFVFGDAHVAAERDTGVQAHVDVPVHGGSEQVAQLGIPCVHPGEGFLLLGLKGGHSLVVLLFEELDELPVLVAGYGLCDQDGCPGRHGADNRAHHRNGDESRAQCRAHGRETGFHAEGTGCIGKVFPAYPAGTVVHEQGGDAYAGTDHGAGKGGGEPAKPGQGIDACAADAATDGSLAKVYADLLPVLHGEPGQGRPAMHLFVDGESPGDDTAYGCSGKTCLQGLARAGLCRLAGLQHVLPGTGPDCVEPRIRLFPEGAFVGVQRAD